MAWFKEGRPTWKTQVTGGRHVFTPKTNRGEYDHRKAESGQYSYGGGGRRVLSDVHEGHTVDVPEIDDRIDSFKKRRKVTPVRAAKSVGLLAAIYGLVRQWRSK